MTPFALPCDYPRIRSVDSFQELATTRFDGGVNALCWPRTLPGDFGEVVGLLGAGESIITLDPEQLTRLDASAAGRAAIRVLREDQRLLRDHGLDPELNCVHDYARDENTGPVSADVFSFHVDRAEVEIDTWLCTYHGPASEGLRHDDARRRVDIPEVRAQLLQRYGGGEGAAFEQHLVDRSYDLHYAPVGRAQPFSFGIGNLWRIATQWPGSLVPPCVHRAPPIRPGQPPRLLLIS